MDQQVTLTIQAKDLEGLIPALDRRQVPKPFTIDGRNFLFNAKGPYSGWGRRLASKTSYHDITEDHNTSIYSFRTVDNNSYLFLNEGIFGYDSESMTFYSVFEFAAPAVDNTYGWTECFVAGKHYFARQGVGVIEYNPTTKDWKLFTNGDLVVGPVSIANVRGRLLILGTSAYQWSALDDPNNLTISLTTGAGLQSTAILGGTSLKVMSLGDNFLVFTSKGIIIGEFSGGQAVFRHRVLTRNYIAINAICIEELDTGSVLFIDQKGLLVTDGTLPQPFSALFSEYLSAQLLRTLRSQGFANYKLFIYKPRKLIFVMISLTGGDEHLERSFVLYLPLQDKWGSFDQVCHGFIELPMRVGTEIQFPFCVVEADGAIKQFTDENYNETTTLPDDGIYWQSDFDLPSGKVNTEYRFRTIITISAERVWLFEGVRSGWYTIGAQIEAIEPPLS